MIGILPGDEPVLTVERISDDPTRSGWELAVAAIPGKSVTTGRTFWDVDIIHIRNSENPNGFDRHVARARTHESFGLADSPAERDRLIAEARQWAREEWWLAGPGASSLSDSCCPGMERVR